MPRMCCDVVGVLFETAEWKKQTVYGRIVVKVKYGCVCENVTSHTLHPPTENLVLKLWAHLPSVHRCLLHLNTNVVIPTVDVFAG